MSQVVFDVSLGRPIKTQSCDICFSRKIKCNRRSPCSSCTGSQTTCTYQRRRRSRRLLRSTQASRQSSPRDEAELPSPESVNPNQPDVESDGEVYGIDLNGFGDTAVNPFAAEPVVTDSMRDEPASGFDSFLASMSATAPWEDGQVTYGPISPFTSSFQAAGLLWPTLCTASTTNPVMSSLQPLLAPSLPPKLSPLSFAAGVTPFVEDPTIPFLVGIFLDRLQPTMPFFRRDFLRENVSRNRHLTDPAFGSLVHAICSLTLLQPVQTQDRPIWTDRNAKAEGHLALAVHLHSRPDLGQRPDIEAIMTSIFLFACNFCKGNHNAAHVRLREASALAEVMELHRVERYGNISTLEMAKRIRTYMCLTIIERIYSIQREYPLYPALQSGPQATELRSIMDVASDDCDDEDLTAMEGLGNMLEQVDFIDSNMVRCWKNTCWIDGALGGHVSSSTILTLLQRYDKPPILSQAADKEALHADILITRFWIRDKLWNLGLRHGYVSMSSENVELRPSYALSIASDAIATCSRFNLSSLETHGVGLVEKLSDIATSALQVVQDPNTLLGQMESPDSNATRDIGFDESDSDLSCKMLRENAEEMLNKFLVLFASFRAGKHPFLKPFMRLLCSLEAGEGKSDG